MIFTPKSKSIGVNISGSLYSLFILIIFVFGSLLLGFNAFSADKNCPPGPYHVKKHHRNGYIKSDGTFVRPTEVKSHCKLLTKVTEYSEVRFKNGIPSDWPHRKELSKSWTEEEKQRLREALNGIPDILLSNKIEGFYRLEKSKDYPNPASSADGIIVLYEPKMLPVAYNGERATRQFCDSIPLLF